MTPIVKTTSEYDKWYWLMVTMLEAYRDPPHPALVPFIDRIVEKDAEFVKKSRDPDYRKAHNAVVLRYLTKEKLTKTAICSALHVSRERLDYWTAQGIHELTMFGFVTGPGYMF